jgi:hypothetical protein
MWLSALMGEDISERKKTRRLHGKSPGGFKNKSCWTAGVTSLPLASGVTNPPWKQTLLCFPMKIPLCWALFWFSISRHLVLNMFPFLLTIGQFLGKFCYVRRSDANEFPHFVYSFISRITYTTPILFTLWFLLCLAKRGEEKKSKNSCCWHGKSAFLCFKRRLQRSTNYICCGFYIVPILLALRCS